MKRVVPMLHVPDVRATADWYQSIGFTVAEINEDDGEIDWAEIWFGTSNFMLNAGGRTSDADRREVDLYVYVEDVDALYAGIRDRVEIVEEPNDTFYGHRIFIIRDPNRFWITFAQALQ